METLRKFSLGAIVIILGLFSSSCKNISIADLQGNWWSLDNDSTYIELYFDGSIFYTFSDKEGTSKPYYFKIQNNNLQFNQTQYKVEKHSGDRLHFSNPEFNFEISKIMCVNPSQDSINELNPYYLRKCVFFVNAGVMSMEEAIEYLNSMTANKDIYIEEKIE